ncbi:alpha/beta-hydrolase, partial [Tothia fuscella]
PTILLDSGTFEGFASRLPNSTIFVNQYLGIPFAAPPLGPLRFKPPVEPAPSDEVYRVDNDPAACIQNGGSSKAFESEDCLKLNVYVPTSSKSIDANGGGLNVMVWLYGGGLQYGWVGNELYDGASLAGNQDLIVVAPNYRTNVFGFPGETPFIPIKERNLGLLDQRMALSWVQKNIVNFGGDPKRVTLFGQSAGARSADFHLLTMAQDPPFRAVIMQSGSAELTPLADAKKARISASKGAAFEQLANALGCKNDTATMECMRAAPAAQIKKIVKDLNLYFGSVDDEGLTTVKDPASVRRAHRAAKVPLLIGTNAHEERGSMGSWRNRTLQVYLDSSFQNHPDLKDKLKSAYRPLHTTDLDVMAAIATDMSFTCITSHEARISTESGYPTWRYLFNASFPNIENSTRAGAYHGSEIQYVFGNLPANATSDEISLSNNMQEVWARFAKNPTEGLGW